MIRLFQYTQPISTILWSIPFLRQYKTKYFLFFLLVGISDSLAFVYVKFIDHHNNHVVYFIMYSLWLISIIDFNFLKKYYFSLVILLLLVSIGICIPDKMNPKIGYLWMVLLSLMISSKFIFDLIKEMSNYKTFNIFIFILIFYLITLASKYLELLSSISFGSFYYLSTNSFEIFIAIFFIIFRYGSPKLRVHIK